MPSTTKIPTPRRARATLASRTARLGADHPETLEARRDFVAERLRAHIEQVVAGAPPLSAEQRTALATLLRPTARVPASGQTSTP
jgi:hypothetical protein